MALSSSAAHSTAASHSFFSPADSFDLGTAQYQFGSNAESRPRPPISRYSYQNVSNPLPQSPLAPPIPIRSDARHLRSVSADPIVSAPPAAQSPAVARQNLPKLSIPTALQQIKSPEKKLTRRSWLPGASNTKPKTEHKATPPAWIAGHGGQPPYDVKSLITGQRVSELWDETGDTFVYLFSPSPNSRPSFRLQSAVYASSSKLTQLAHGGNRRTASLETKRSSFENGIRQTCGPILPPTPPITPKRTRADNSSSGSSRHTRATLDSFDDPPRQFHLHLSIPLSTKAAPEHALFSEEDVNVLIAVRNMFAFLVGQCLVATDGWHTIFDIFMKISNLLLAYDFTNIDGSTFGEVAATSFDNYVQELNIADVRLSREKTIEALVLGERMRSAMLYNEAFTHAVGKCQDILAIAQLPGPGLKFSLVHPVTRSRMERASLDLAQREKSIQNRLLDFDFPSVFAGVMSSKMVSERKYIRFDAWKTSFGATRRNVLAYYKQKFGSWPPKASSKKNNLETSGLNRLVLKELYADFGEMYDLYVDRTSLTTRSMGSMYPVSHDGETTDASNLPVHRIIRRVCDEYDRSYPPVQPPIPFDTPILPSLSKESQLQNARLKDEDVIWVLDGASNSDTLPAATTNKSPFLAYMRAFELRQAKGKTLTELIDFRAGMWIFMYVVLQALPMLTVDAPGVSWRKGVEYFLCQPPRGGAPWVKSVSGDGISSKRSAMHWYGVSGSQGVVSLPADLVEHGVEGVYHRSHCWLMATKWSGPTSFKKRPSVPSARSSLEKQLAPPPSLLDRSNVRGTRSAPGSQPGSREPSPAATTRRLRQEHSVLTLGLEALPMPPGVSPELRSSRSGSFSLQASQGCLTPANTSSSFESQSGSGLSQPTSPRHGEDFVNMNYRRPLESARASGMTFNDILGSIEQANAADTTVKKGFKSRKSSK